MDSMESDNPVFNHASKDSLMQNAPPPVFHYPSKETVNQVLHNASKDSLQKSETSSSGPRNNGKSSSLPNKRISARGLPLPENTTLNKDDWDMIEDSLIPFQATAILISLGGVALIGLAIHALHNDPNLIATGHALLGGVGGSSLLDFFITLPIIVGVITILLALFFNCLAALESWQHVSIQDVIAHHLPDELEVYAKRIPLTCTARKVYLILMFFFLVSQLVASSVAYGLTKFINDEANKGADSVSSNAIVRSVLDYSSAVFNECCHNQGWSNQGQVPVCPPDVTTVDDCFPSTDRFYPLRDKLCACMQITPELEQEYVSYVNESSLCSYLSIATVPIVTGQKIPGTTVSMKSLMPVNKIPLVGNQNTQYGCGAGYLRGFQWSVTQWGVNQLLPYFVAMMIISGLQILFLFIGGSVVCRIKLSPQATRVGEDGNVEYGVSEPIAVPRTLGELWKRDENNSTRAISPKLVMPSFRTRKNSPVSKNLQTPSPLAIEPSSYDGLTSPDLLKLAAQRTSQPRDVEPLHISKDGKRIDIDDAI